MVPGTSRIQSFFDMPRLELSLSIRVDPHSGIEAHSLETSLDLHTIRADIDVLSRVFREFENRPKREVGANEVQSPLSETPALSSRLSWVSPLSPTSPLLETLSVSPCLHYCWFVAGTHHQRLPRPQCLLIGGRDQARPANSVATLINL